MPEEERLRPSNLLPQHRLADRCSDYVATEQAKARVRMDVKSCWLYDAV